MSSHQRVSFLCFVFFVAGVLPSLVWARKFDFKNEAIATYFKGTYGPSQVLLAPYGESSGAETTAFDQKIETNYSGEFGLVLSTTILTLRVAVELLMPKHISDVRGKNAAGDELFLLDTQTSALVPMAYVDYNFYTFSTSKAFVGLGVGHAYIKMENDYQFTDVGRTTYNMSDFVEKAEGQTVSTHVYAGYEMLFADNATVVFDIGYRKLYANTLNHLNAVTTFNGPVARGAQVVKNDSGPRDVDFSGAYVGMAFRFYIGL